MSRAMSSFHHDLPIRVKANEEATPESGLSESALNPPEPMGETKNNTTSLSTKKDQHVRGKNVLGSQALQKVFDAHPEGSSSTSAYSYSQDEIAYPRESLRANADSKQPATGDNGSTADVSGPQDSVSGEIRNPRGKDVDMKELTDTRSVDGLTGRLFNPAAQTMLQAELYHTKYNVARATYTRNKFCACREKCLSLLEVTDLPWILKCQTLRLLACCSYAPKAQEYLERALIVCDEVYLSYFLKNHMIPTDHKRWTKFRGQQRATIFGRTSI